MIFLLLIATVDRVETTIDAEVSAGLSQVRVHVASRYEPAEPIETVSIVLAADRYRQLPPKFLPVRARELFRGGAYSFGGLEVSKILVDGKTCDPKIEAREDGARILTCPFGQTIEIDAVLDVPERYGAFASHRDQLTLAGGWYPYVARIGAPAPRGPHKLSVKAPPDHRALGPLEREDVAQIPLLVVPENVRGRSIDGGRARIYARAHDSAEARELQRAIRDALIFLDEENLSPKKPWQIVIAGLRHELAVPLSGTTLVSDRAFRMLSVERFLRFHRFPVIRALYTAHFLAEGRDRPTAEASAAWLADRFVRSRHGRAEDAFDVLGFWSFIPAIDILLYAPDVPFEGAYFKRVDETDPLSPNLVDYPSPYGHGRVIFEKLLDRIGRPRTDAVFLRVLRGASLEAAIEPELGAAETKEFHNTWLAPYPSVRYRLADWSSEGNTARVTIEREGAPVTEPVQVRLVDDDDYERILWTETTSAATRTLTATMSAPLELVELDPFGRLIETPTERNPSPRLDNRSSARWKVLINNWNISLGATEGTVDTALDLGFSREYDVRWRYAIRADYDPAAIGFSTRASYAFGESVTRSRLLQAIGFALEGAYLRPEFGDAVDSAFVAAGRVSWSYDDRASVWAAEPGTSLSATLEYAHVFGQVVEQIAGEQSRLVSQDSLSFSARAVRSFRLPGANQLSLRATAGAYLFGDPRRQILFRVGGRPNVRGYPVDATLGEARAIASAEWTHALMPEMNENAFVLWYVSGVDGALYADAAIIADELSELGSAPFLADVGYGLRLYIDYFGVRPGVMAIDLAFPLFDVQGRRDLGPPAVYIDFSQSF